MAFSEVYQTFLQETIEDHWDMEDFFLAGLRNLWYLFLDPIWKSSERLRLINPNYLRYQCHFIAASNVLEKPINETTYAILLRKIYKN